MRFVFTPVLRQAASDLRWHYDKGYPRNASVKLVGDRYRLGKESRMLILRGVSSTASAAYRRGLLVPPKSIKGRGLAVDGHNVVLTVANYMAGVPVFEADDGILRDIGALHGRVHDERVMKRSLDLLAGALAVLGPASVLVVFDSPVSHSRDHAGYLRNRMNVGSEPVVVVPSGDQTIKDQSREFVATSDSALIDALGRGVFDLARYVLESEFSVEWDTFGVPPYSEPPSDDPPSG